MEDTDAVSVESRRINLSHEWQLPCPTSPDDYLESWEVFGTFPLSFCSLLSQQAFLRMVGDAIPGLGDVVVNTVQVLFPRCLCAGLFHMCPPRPALIWAHTHCVPLPEGISSQLAAASFQIHGCR